LRNAAVELAYRLEINEYNGAERACGSIAGTETCDE